MKLNAAGGAIKIEIFKPQRGIMGDPLIPHGTLSPNIQIFYWF